MVSPFDSVESSISGLFVSLFVLSSLRQVGPSTGSGTFLTGWGCWYWPRSGVHGRFLVGDGRPTAAGEAFHYDWLPGGGEALRPDDGLERRRVSAQSRCRHTL